MAGEQGTQLSGEVASLQLVRVLPDVTGQLDGDFELALAPEGEASGRIDVEISEGVLRFDTGQGVQRLDHGGGALTASLGREGLSSDLIARPLARGDIRAQLQLPALRRLPPDNDRVPLTKNDRPTAPPMAQHPTERTMIV